MRLVSFLAASAAVVELVVAGALFAQPTTNMSVVQQAMPKAGAVVQLSPGSGIRRSISLEELGFKGGIDMLGLTGSRALFFPVPAKADVERLQLRLPYMGEAAFESRRSLEVQIADRPVMVIPLTGSRQQGMVDIPIDIAAIRDGYIAVRLNYNGAITEDRCVDQRVSGAFLNFSGAGGLVVDLKPGAAGNLAKVAAMMPRMGSIYLPAGASTGQAAAALTLAAGNADMRVGAAAQHETAEILDGWTHSSIALLGNNMPALRLAPGASGPTVEVGGQDPAAAARFLISRWRSLSVVPTLAGASRSQSGKDRDRITFADLGVDLSSQSIADRGIWTAAIPATALAPDQAIGGLVIDIAVADDGSETPAIVSVTMNGVLIGSTQAQKGSVTHLQLDVPDGLATTRNEVQVAVTRQVRSGDCAYAPQGYPAQLLPSSRLLLKKAAAPADFSDLAPAFSKGVTVVLSDSGQVAALAPLLRGLVSGTTPITVSYGKLPAAGPVILVSRDPPADATFPVRFDQGRVRLVAEGGETLIDETAIAAFTVAQLITVDGRPMLWVRPGKDFASFAQSELEAGLSRGNVAFLDGGRISLALSTERDRLIDIRYPDQASLSQWLARYRLWLIGLGWLIVSAGFIYLLRRVYIARSSNG